MINTPTIGPFLQHLMEIREVRLAVYLFLGLIICGIFIKDIIYWIKYPKESFKFTKNSLTAGKTGVKTTVHKERVNIILYAFFVAAGIFYLISAYLVFKEY